MGNVVSLPPLLPDEDYRSILFRYHRRSPHISYIKSRKEFIGRRVSNPILFPQNLSILQDELEVSEDFIMMVIQNHTYYPLLRPFFSETENIKYLNSMIVGGVASLSSRTVLEYKGRKLIHEFVHYCPDCINEDIQSFGECYVHRMHQLIDIKNCPKHQITLQSHCHECGVSYGTETGSKYIVEPFCANGHAISSVHSEEKESKIIKNYLEDVESLVDAEDLHLNTLYIKLIAHVGARGWIHYKGNFISKKKILTDFVAYYGEDSLRRLGIFPELLFVEKFVVEFLNPIHFRKLGSFYMLIMRFLSGSVKFFLSSEVTYSMPIPFGNGPWPCVNNICPLYNQRVIKRCKRKSHEWITGFFTCPFCGLVYFRKGYPKEENEEQFSVETRGPLFIQQAIQFYEEGFNIEEIAQKLKSNRTSVRKYLKPQRKSDLSEMDLAIIRTELELGPKQAAATLNLKMEICKKTVRDAIETLGPTSTRQQIREYNIHRYDWLMKNDREWMEVHLPSRRVNPRKLNLHTLDDELYTMIVQAVEETYKNPPPSKINKMQILKKLPSKIRTRIDRYPEFASRTVCYLEDHVETIDQYLIRRFPEVIKWFEESRYKRCSLKLLEMRFPQYRDASEDTRRWIKGKLKTMIKGFKWGNGGIP